MKKIYTLLIVLFSALAVNAQTVQQGDILINGGLGVASYDTDNLDFPALAISADYLAQDQLFDEHSSLSMGAYLGYHHQSVKNVYASDKTSTLILGVRSDVHYDFLDRLDTYAGLMLAYKHQSFSNERKVGATLPGGIVLPAGSDSSSDGKFLLGIHVGARYFFTENLGAFAEVGYGVSPLEIGVTYKF